MQLELMHLFMVSAMVALRLSLTSPISATHKLNMHQANPIVTSLIYPALTRQAPPNPNPAIGWKPCYTSGPKCSYFVPGSSRSYFKMQLFHLTFLPGSQIFTKLNSCLARDKTSSWSP